MRKSLSLRAQAVVWLAQREYSERELRLRLLRHLRELERRLPAGGERLSSNCGNEVEVTTWSPGAASLHQPDICVQAPSPSAISQVDTVVEWLLERGYLDEQRFVASRVHVRSARFGVARIEQELSRHGLDLPQDALQTLRSSELDRARAVWERRFGSPPVDPREEARQARFLNGRGFSGEVIRRVVPRCSAAVNSTEGSD